MNQFLNTLILTLPLIANSHADTIYKTVDEQGRTSYSSTPPESGKKTTTIKTTPAPSNERIEAAQQRHKRNVNAAEIMDENRMQRNEKIEEENRLKQQRQLQQNKQTEDANDTQHYGYPYYPRRPLHKPVVRPPVHRPAQPLR